MSWWNHPFNFYYNMCSAFFFLQKWIFHWKIHIKKFSWIFIFFLNSVKDGWKHIRNSGKKLKVWPNFLRVKFFNEKFKNNKRQISSKRWTTQVYPTAPYSCSHNVRYLSDVQHLCSAFSAPLGFTEITYPNSFTLNNTWWAHHLLFFIKNHFFVLAFRGGGVERGGWGIG